jgi:hypothetical protein
MLTQIHHTFEVGDPKVAHPNGMSQVRSAPVVTDGFLPAPVLPAHQPGVHHRRRGAQPRRPPEQPQSALPLRLHTFASPARGSGCGYGSGSCHGVVLDASAIRVQRRGLAQRPQRVPPRAARSAGRRDVGGARGREGPVDEIRRESGEVRALRRRCRRGPGLMFFGVPAAPAVRRRGRRRAGPGGEGRRRGGRGRPGLVPVHQRRRESPRRARGGGRFVVCCLAGSRSPQDRSMSCHCFSTYTDVSH